MHFFDLQDLHIMVTRPDPAGSMFCAWIEKQGGRATHLPTIAIVSLSDSQAFVDALSFLAEQDWLIFISPQAVYQSIPAIRKRWPHLSTQAKFVAVGGGTAKALSDIGYPVDLQPETDWSSEGLLQLPLFQSLLNQKIAIIRGAGGRELLEKELRSRGGKILSVMAYERTLPLLTMKPYLALLQDKMIDLVIGTSGEGIQNLKILIGKDGFHSLKKVPLLVVSERIKRLAQDLGFQTIWVARQAGNEAIAECINAKKDELWQIKQKKK